ncbi:TPA: hypothetical protein I8370_001887 [Klebsiella oxytoca]|nr:hypothetical protein [Klebsiella oxytoca]
MLESAKKPSILVSYRFKTNDSHTYVIARMDEMHLQITEYSPALLICEDIDTWANNSCKNTLHKFNSYTLISLAKMLNYAHAVCKQCRNRIDPSKQEHVQKIQGENSTSTNDNPWPYCDSIKN